MSAFSNILKGKVVLNHKSPGGGEGGTQTLVVRPLNKNKHLCVSSLRSLNVFFLGESVDSGQREQYRQIKPP